MPEEPESPENLHGHHRPHLSDHAKETTEEDLWDLDDDSPTPSLDRSSPAESGPPSAESSDVGRKGNSARRDAQPSNLYSIDPGGTKPAPPKAFQPNGPKIHDSEIANSPLPEAESPSLNPDQPASSPSPKKSDPLATPAGGPVGTHEKLALMALAVLFLGLAIWWISGLFSSIETTRLGEDQPDFPAKGAFTTIKNAETFWREPIREGVRPDVARREVAFIPVLSVTLDDGETGVLRAIFRNEQGDFVGDSISQGFANGVFDLNASPTVEFAATDGFESLGEFNGYRVGEDRWTIEVFEGPSFEAPGSEYKLLFTAPISTNRQ